MDIYASCWDWLNIYWKDEKPFIDPNSKRKLPKYAEGLLTYHIDQQKLSFGHLNPNYVIYHNKLRLFKLNQVRMKLFKLKWKILYLLNRFTKIFYVNNH